MLWNLRVGNVIKTYVSKVNKLRCTIYWQHIKIITLFYLQRKIYRIYYFISSYRQKYVGCAKGKLL